jgi:hypothetical protein
VSNRGANQPRSARHAELFRQFMAMELDTLCTQSQVDTNFAACFAIANSAKYLYPSLGEHDVRFWRTFPTLSAAQSQKESPAEARRCAPPYLLARVPSLVVCAERQDPHHSSRTTRICSIFRVPVFVTVPADVF